MNWKKLQKIFFVVFLCSVIAFAAIYAIWGVNIDFLSIRREVGGFGIYAPLVFMIIYIIGVTFLPSTPFMAASGVLFGFSWGLIYTIIAGFINSMFVFFLSRKLGKEWVESILQHKYARLIDKYNQRLGSDGLWDLILLRIAPIMPFNVLNVLMGVSRIGKTDYVFGTILGLLPSNFLAVYFGDLIVKFL